MNAAKRHLVLTNRKLKYKVIIFSLDLQKVIGIKRLAENNVSEMTHKGPCVKWDVKS